MVNFVEKNKLLPKTLRTALDDEGMNAMSAGLLTEVAPTLPDFDRLGEDFVVFFEPPALDERIVNQYALFSVMPSPHARMDEWLEERPDLARRVVRHAYRCRVTSVTGHALSLLPFARTTRSAPLRSMPAVAASPGGTLAIARDQKSSTSPRGSSSAGCANSRPRAHSRWPGSPSSSRTKASWRSIWPEGKKETRRRATSRRSGTRVSTTSR